MDVETLSRLQFAFTISFHYIYPPLSIGLGLCMVAMEGLFIRTADKLYENMAKFFTKIFALIFGLGVATGIVMEFEFGTNWATYSKYVGDVFGSALAAEGIFAFALEAGFLGVLVFGWDKVKPRTHMFATVMVFLGSMFSAIWIVVANSWQQTPQGFKVVGDGLNARAEITNFWAMVFNPSSVERVLHVWVGSFLSGSFLVISISAYYILRNKHMHFAKTAFKIALVIATVSSVSQLFIGHKSAEVVSEYQPTKLAAFEGHFDSLAVADIYVFGYVDKKNEKTVGLKIPKGLTFLTHQNFTTPIKGLKYFPEKDRPASLNTVFQFYHIMITIGMILIALTLYACILWRKGKLFNKRWLMMICMFSVFLPQLANQAGWFAAETGRQPWVVYGLLRTSDALSKAVTANHVWFSLILFTLVYLLLFILFIYLLNKKIMHGPYHDEAEHRPKQITMAEQF
jgi:cytochrome bd ubiquinol oxidase subunit I